MKTINEKRIIRFLKAYLHHLVIVILADITMEIMKSLF